jgi:hypothetical protein
MILHSCRLSWLSLLVLGLFLFGCTDANAKRESSASLDRIDLLIAEKEWKEARGEIRRMLEKDLPRLSGAALVEVRKRLDAQTLSLAAGELEESRARLESTHTSVEDFFAELDADKPPAARSCAGKEVRIKGRIGMLATDRFDRPYLTLQSSSADDTLQAIFLKNDRLHDRVARSAEAVFATCTCDGREGRVVIMSRCQLDVPTTADGFAPRRPNEEGPTTCAEEPRRCG